MLYKQSGNHGVNQRVNVQLQLHFGEIKHKYYYYCICTIPETDIIISGQKLQVVTEFKYLGV